MSPLPTENNHVYLAAFNNIYERLMAAKSVEGFKDVAEGKSLV